LADVVCNYISQKEKEKVDLLVFECGVHFFTESELFKGLVCLGQFFETHSHYAYIENTSKCQNNQNIRRLRGQLFTLLTL